ncbi:hypothetical protein AC26_2901 [Escherichia coli 1-176-05_S3_C2]|nr:hypothetical protein AC26_2901 [Escherichia coli 1-176-05_S3_C2]
MTFLLLLITLEIINHVDKKDAREGINIAIVERYRIIKWLRQP